MKLTGCVGLIASGIVAECTMMNHGEEFIIRLASKGTFLGLVDCGHTYQAVEDCYLTVIPAEHVQGVDATLVQALKRENQELTQALLNQVGRPLIDRVKSAIDALVNLGIIRATNGAPEIGKRRLRPGLIRILGRLAGSGPESTSRMLKRIRLEAV